MIGDAIRPDRSHPATTRRSELLSNSPPRPGQKRTCQSLQGLGQNLQSLMKCPVSTMELTVLKAVVHRFYADVWNMHDKSAIPALLQPDFTFRGSLGQCKTGHAEFADYVDFVHQALGAYQCDILDLVAEGNQCFARMRFSGIHRGNFFSYKPTGKKVEWAGAALFTFRDGLVADLWVLGDVHGLLQLLESNSE
jgi:predicted ester cyclase